MSLLRHHTLVGTRCWQSRTRVFVVFHYHFHTAAVQRRFGIVEGLVQRYADSENWFVRKERRCEDDFVVPVPFWNIGLMLFPLNAAGQISDFRRWLVQQQYFWECSQWRGGPYDRRCGSAWEQRGWSRCVGHSSQKKFKPWRHWPLNRHFEKPERSNTRYRWHGVSIVTSRPHQQETGTEVCLLRRITLGLTVSREARKDSRKEGRCDSTCGVQKIRYVLAHRNEHVLTRSAGDGMGADWLWCH